MYERYAPLFFGVCKRYVSTPEDAEDVLVEAMYKIFTNIDQYRNEGSFEGWMRRIVINEALMFLRRRNHFKYTVELEEVDEPVPVTIEQELAAQDILHLLDQLPTGYRTVFNLYVLEGYKHREIADMLDISINTSKSQLILARKKMESLLEQKQYPTGMRRVSEGNSGAG